MFIPTEWPHLGIDILHSLHGPGFALIALLVLWYLQRQHRSVTNYILAAGITLFIGLLSEVAQIPGPRDAQLKDVVTDALGIFGAVGVAASLDQSFRPAIFAWARFTLPALAGAALIITIVPSIWLGYALIQQKNTFPVLLTFENYWETAAFGQTATARPSIAPAPPGWPGDGTSVAHAVEDGRWGIFLSLQPLRDWRGYSQVSFVAASVNDPFVMDIGIREIYHDKSLDPNRYYTSMRIEPQAKTFTVTFDQIQAEMTDRPFHFSRVESIVFSAVTPGNRQEVLLDDIRLEP